MAALACPYKPVPQRERVVPAAHAHRYECELALDDPSLWVQDCACGHRRLVRKAEHGAIVKEYPEALVPGGSSWDNGVFVFQLNGSWTDRWASQQLL